VPPSQENPHAPFDIDPPGAALMFGRRGVPAIPVADAAAVRKGKPGSFYISRDRTEFHLRCPCGRCEKSNTLPLEGGYGAYVWNLSGTDSKPSLSPSIHWFERDGVRTHWHGWLTDGQFVG
jgi:hypothetical protein